MRGHHGNRARLGGVLMAVALGALAMLALPAIGSGKDGGGEDAPRAAGTIESFDAQTGLLVVDLGEGRKIAGLVVRRTQVRCDEDDRGHRRHQRRHRRGRGPGASASDSGRGREGDEVRPSEGGDRPSQAREPGEDPPGHDGTAPGASEDPGRGEERSARCLDQLVPGAIVVRAEIVLMHGNAFFKKIGVLPPAPVETPEAPGTE